MTKFNAETVQVQTAVALERVIQAGRVREHALYVGLDVHKETIAVAVASPGREEPTYRIEIANKPKAVAKLIGRLSRESDGAVMLFCYEADPCGYELYRQILGMCPEPTRLRRDEPPPCGRVRVPRTGPS